jgi:hypothetical protein
MIVEFRFQCIGLNLSISYWESHLLHISRFDGISLCIYNVFICLCTSMNVFDLL